MIDTYTDQLAGISTLDSAASRRALSELQDAQEAHAREVEQLREDFSKAASECQADKYALFAPRVLDLKFGGTRLQTVGEVLASALDYREFTERAMGVLLKAATTDGEAKKLLDEVIANWADMEAQS